jgi:hypothetical protein
VFGKWRGSYHKEILSALFCIPCLLNGKTKRKLAEDRGNFHGKRLTLLLDMQYYAEAQHIKGTNIRPAS